MNQNRYQIYWNDISKYRAQIYGIVTVWIMIFHNFIVGCSIDSSSFVGQFIGKVIGRGNMGVDIFLFLSGCFLYYSYANYKGNVLAFEKKRLIRLCLPVFLIYGPYWVYLLITEGGIWQFFLRVSLMEFWINGTQKIWFVSLILIFYLLYPFIYEIFFDKKRAGKIMPLLCVLLCVFVFTYSIYMGEKEYYNTFNIALTRFPVFIIGCWCGKLCKDGKRIPTKAVILSALIVAATLYIYMYVPVSGIWGRYIYITSIAYIIVLIWILKVINCNWINKIFAFFGKMSLELYLCHILFINIYKGMSVYQKGSWRNYIVVLICATVASQIVYMIENTIKRKSNKNKA